MSSSTTGMSSSTSMLNTNPSPAPKRVKPRRPRATLRERQRMQLLNQGFDDLRQVVPRTHLADYQKLSKIATLRLAIQYIRAMNQILQHDHWMTTTPIVPIGQTSYVENGWNHSEPPTTSVTAPGMEIVSKNSSLVSPTNVEDKDICLNTPNYHHVNVTYNQFCSSTGGREVKNAHHQATGFVKGQEETDLSGCYWNVW